MLNNITIPPAALEAGARALREEVRRALNVEEQDPPEGPSQALINAYRAEARAAFVAMVEAWPEMEYVFRQPTRYSVCYSKPAFILPLPQEVSDDA